MGFLRHSYGWIFLSCLFVFPFQLRGQEAGFPQRILSWNVHNWLETPRRVGEDWKYAYPKPEEERRLVREWCLEVEADLILLQEMGDAARLEQLRQNLAALGLSYDWSHWMRASEGNRHLAALGRRAPDWMIEHRLSFPYGGEMVKIRRGLLELGWNWKGSRVACILLHGKSRYTSNPQDPQSDLFRKGEVDRLVHWIYDRMEESHWDAFLLLGDWNAEPGSPAFAALRDFRWDGQKLVRLSASDPDGHDWTYFHQRTRRWDLVDYIFQWGDWPDSFRATLPRWERTIGASDHRPLLLDRS